MTAIADKLTEKVFGELYRGKPNVRFDVGAKGTGMVKIEAPASGESRRQQLLPALALGMPWAELSWGGKYSGRLPVPMRAASVASASILLVLALVVMIRAGLLLPRWHSLSQKVMWGVVAYCGVAVLAHIFTPSKWERTP